MDTTLQRYNSMVVAGMHNIDRSYESRQPGVLEYIYYIILVNAHTVLPYSSLVHIDNLLLGAAQGVHGGSAFTAHVRVYSYMHVLRLALF